MPLSNIPSKDGMPMASIKYPAITEQSQIRRVAKRGEVGEMWSPRA